ncbi:unnamed protein product [Peniophora sp. CBMAI 1063]|nr:unnamed protein product [Peniophora sp. CBMAI 1063]
MFALRKLFIRTTSRHTKCAEVMQYEAAPTSPIISRHAPAHAPFFFEDQTSGTSNESNLTSPEPELERCLASEDFSSESHQARVADAEDALMRAADPLLMDAADRLGEQLDQADGRVDQDLCPELEEVLARMLALRTELGI